MDENNQIDPYYDDWAQEAVNLLGEDASELVSYVADNKINIKEGNLRPIDVYEKINRQAPVQEEATAYEPVTNSNLHSRLEALYDKEPVVNSFSEDRQAYQAPERFTQAIFEPTDPEKKQLPPDKDDLFSRIHEALDESERSRLSNG